MSNKKTTPSHQETTETWKYLAEEELSALEKLKKLSEADDFPGFVGCGHAHQDETGILWNDAGHRTQVEQAIWILTVLEPGNAFLSLWSEELFRRGFYTGLWQADYRAPWNNYLYIPGLYDGGTYTSHFFNPKNGNHYGKYNKAITAARIVHPDKDWNETAYSQVVKQHYEAAKLHDSWKDTPTDQKLTEMGRLLGIATHYFTDLTQPMHAANFTNGFGPEGHSIPNKEDLRHGNYEDLADHIINNPTHLNHKELFQDPALAADSFTDNLHQLLIDTATNSWNIFDDQIKGKIDKWPFKSLPPLAEALPAYKRAFPSGQIATAKFFQQWARQSHDQNPSKRLRSDHVSITVRRDGSKTLQPAVFYRRDGDLCPIFRFLDQGVWREDAITFAEFAGHSTNTATVFATCFDKLTDHPSLFISNHLGQLFYFDIQQSHWKKTEIKTNEVIRGSIVSTYDEHYNKPCAFYRSKTGTLQYIYWKDNKFAVSSLSDFPKVGGAISVVWDPTPCGYGDKGHVAVSYVGGDGFIHHLNVRNGGWKHTVLSNMVKGTHADAQILASVYDQQEKKVGIFWGLVEYIKREVPESKPTLFFRERQFPMIMFSSLHDSPITTNLKVRTSGGITATSQPNPMVYYISAGYTRNTMTALERKENKWTRHISQKEAVGMIASSAIHDKTVMIGARLKNRSCFVEQYKESSFQE